MHQRRSEQAGPARRCHLHPLRRPPRQRHARDVLHRRGHLRRPEAGFQRGAHHRRPLLRRKRGAAIGHVSPEAASGGPIGLIEEGDTINIDIPNASITLEVSDEVLAQRKAKYVAPEPNIKTGWLSRYARMVTSANLGAVLK